MKELENRPGLQVILCILVQKIEKKRKRIEQLKQEILERIAYAEKQYQLAAEFEKKHWKELQSIWESNRYGNTYLLVFNDILNEIDHLRLMLEKPTCFDCELCDLTKGISEDETGVFPLKNICEESGLSGGLVKILLKELIQMRKIESRKTIGGYSYKVL